MFRLLQLQVRLPAATMLCYATKLRVTSPIHLRYQSTISQKQDSSLKSMSDEEVDQWLRSIEELKEEFKLNGNSLESSLAPPGKGKVDLVKETEKLREDLMGFKPTEAQIEEFNSLRDKPIPLREDPILKHITNMIMRHGKKEKAEKILSRALYLVFIQTRKDPIDILKKALDDLGPLMITKTFNTGVAKAAVIPVPLTQRQRNRIAWKWIVEGANQRASSDFAVRLGEELVSVFEGIGSGFDKRDQLHKTAIAHRAYIKLK
ncbi:hypothetical protein KAFR_0G00830 [Kazachstania africana CBS 2517]|uniref:Small ribosomal subunit protein uS7m n=1 Tax=Kazachstania africana (strain ATCC 22294 / BCRC 22015 / CBS 2517 / CECT 1963 / NBRC 1671 / NRRL Y-8276) TaxID=1071382 RepID=H2AXL6_KAZAF|nr:hypothetical protein KAFR_0G00830 [Kazachstania africana CBS 2517]CCF59116.1 hypothetical protein KAFR_0G00830 [Kazachstania africana CBS 2517]